MLLLTSEALLHCGQEDKVVGLMHWMEQAMKLDPQTAERGQILMVRAFA